MALEDLKDSTEPTNIIMVELLIRMKMENLEMTFIQSEVGIKSFSRVL
jgi:hypothetical protein